MKFSIRELLLVTVIVALIAAWALERWRSELLRRQLESSQNEIQVSQSAIKDLHADIARIENELAPHDLGLSWSRELRPSLKDLGPKSKP